MKGTQVLLQQHVGRLFREIWKVQGKRILIDNGALKELKLKGIPVENANDLIKERRQQPYLELESFPPKVITMDEKHPDYHEESCYKYSDNNVLLGGIDQAKVFTNSCELDFNTLPFSDHLTPSEESFEDALVKRYIKGSLLFDATQVKLPKRKDPERPAFVFPRDYGISYKRKNFLLGKRLLQLCSILSPQLCDHRRVVGGPLNFQAGLRRNGKNILLSITADELVTSEVNIKSVVNQETVQDVPLPDIYPLSPLVSFEHHHIYKFVDFFPINENIEKSHVHTILIHYNQDEVANLFETDVTESQILSRSLMKCYTVALTQARRRYGESVQDLPEPVTVQCVQTDTKKFHFCVLQLNTTRAPEDTSTRNAFWSLPLQSIFETCDYVDGRPQFIGYNPLVFKTLLTFFRND